MTEHEWLTCDDPKRMLDALRDHIGHISDRKLRLFACACCRQVWHLLMDDVECPYCKDARFDTGDYGGPLLSGSRLQRHIASRCACGGTRRLNRSRRVVEVAEQFADGEASCEDLATARAAAWAAARDARAAVWAVWAAGDADWAVWAAGDPVWAAGDAVKGAQAHLLRDIIGNPWRPVVTPKAEYVCPWLTPTVLSLARAVYNDRLPDGILDPVRLAIVADALEEAGCTTEELLTHMRSPGPHVRDCWALDLVLGKDRE